MTNITELLQRNIDPNSKGNVLATLFHIDIKTVIQAATLMAKMPDPTIDDANYPIQTIIITQRDKFFKHEKCDSKHYDIFRKIFNFAFYIAADEYYRQRMNILLVWVIDFLHVNPRIIDELKKDLPRPEWWNERGTDNDNAA